MTSAQLEAVHERLDGDSTGEGGSVVLQLKHLEAVRPLLLCSTKCHSSSPSHLSFSSTGLGTVTPLCLS